MKAVMFSAYGDRRLLSDAIAAGARGYVMKGSPPEDLLRAIRTVVAGKAFVDPSLSPVLVMTDGMFDAPLTQRERAVQLPRFWIAMQIAIVILCLTAAVIAVVKLS